VASKNGTILNGKKIPQPTKLQSGDRSRSVTDDSPSTSPRSPANPPSRGDPIRQIPGYPLWVGSVADIRDLRGVLTAGIEVMSTSRSMNR